MQSKWEGIVTDPEERKVFSALADPNWDFRTVEGLSKSTGLSYSEIENIIAKYKDLVRQSPVPDKKGRNIYTLSEKGPNVGEWLNFIRGSVVKTSG